MSHGKSHTFLAAVTTTAAQGESNLIFVDSIFGSDLTGKPNQRYQPFKTIGSAVSACKNLPGFYTIIVHPGTYLETMNLLTNAKYHSFMPKISLSSYYFEPGCVIQNGSQTPLFGDTPNGIGVMATIAGTCVLPFCL